MPPVIFMRRRHLDNTTFCVFPKHVILKRENNNYSTLLFYIILNSPYISISTPYTCSTLLFYIQPTFNFPIPIPAQVVFPQCFYPMFGIEPPKKHKGLVGEENDFCALGILHPSMDSFSFFHPTTISSSTRAQNPNS